MLEQQLARFRRNGTFRLFIDESGIPPIPTTPALYCLVGQSRKKDSPFNTIVEIATVEELHNTFGKRDRNDERRGNFFILMAEQLLTQGQPIYMLNLRDYDDDQVIEFRGHSVQNDVQNGELQSQPLKEIFDRNTFWRLKTRSIKVDGSLLSLGTYSGKNVTAYVRPARNGVDLFRDQTIGQYQAEYPEAQLDHLPQNMLVRDLLLEVHLFGRDLTNTSAILSPDLQNLLDADGRIGIDQIDQLQRIPEAQYIGSITGAITPEILDEQGNSLYLQTLVNAAAPSTGVFCYINEDEVYKYAGWNPEDGTQPYVAALADFNLTNTGGIISLEEIDAISYQLSAASEDTPADVLNVSMFADLNELAPVYDIDGTEPADLNSLAENVAFVRFEAAVGYANDVENRRVLYSVGNQFLAKDVRVINSANVTARIVNHVKVGDVLDVPELQTIDLVVDPATNLPFPQNDAGDWLYPDGFVQAGDVVNFDATTGLAQYKPADLTDPDEDLPQPTLTAAEETALNQEYGILYPIFRSTLNSDVRFDNGGSVDNVELTLTNGSTIAMARGTFTAIRTLDNRSKTTGLGAIALKGVQLKDTQFVNGTSIRQNNIIDLINTPGIKSGLMDYERYPFWFILDSFKTYIEPNTKAQFTRLCAEAIRFAYIGALPNFADFEDSVDPLFKDGQSEPLDVSYIVQGGNQALPFSRLFSLPNPDNGDYFGLFAGPELSYNDGFGEVSVPPTAAIALLYGANFLQAGRNPYTSVNGTSTGQLGVPNISTPAYRITEEQREILEPAGFNTIQLRTVNGNQTSLQIRSSKSAKNTSRSALSQFENTMLLLFVAREIQAMLDFLIDELPKRNTPEKRQKAVNRANRITAPLLANGTLERVIHTSDLSNNPAPVRAQGYLVLDSELFIAGGAKIAVHRTIARGPVDDE